MKPTQEGLNLYYHARLGGDLRRELREIYFKHAVTQEQLKSVEQRNRMQAAQLTSNDAFFKWFKAQPEHAVIGERWKEQSTPRPIVTLTDGSQAEVFTADEIK